MRYVVGLYCGAIVKSMICGEGGNAPGCVCSGCGGIGGSASGAREKNHHKAMNTTTTNDKTNTIA